MKTTIKLGSIEVKGIKINDIEVTKEHTLSEAIGLIRFGKHFTQELIKELPEMLEDLEIAFNKFNEIDKRVEEQQRKEYVEKLMSNISNLLNK